MDQRRAHFGLPMHSTCGSAEIDQIQHINPSTGKNVKGYSLTHVAPAELLSSC